MQQQASLRSVFFLACLMVSSCQTAGGVRERLDPDSGLTIVTDPTTMSFARTQAQLSRSARDYVYLGPVELNERGTRQYFLWVGIASTIDRDYLAQDAMTPDRLYLAIEDTPVEFELMPWAERVPALAGVEIYDPAVEPFAVLAARVSLDQLALLSHRPIRSLRTATATQRTSEYYLWETASPWPVFSSYAGM